MNLSLPPVVRRRFIDGLIIIAGVLGCVTLFNFIVEESIFMSGIVIVGLGVIFWACFSRGLWWVLVPLAVCFGGMIYIGFKILAVEFALLVVLIAAIPRIASHQVVSRPAFLPKSLYLLLAYLLARLTIDLYCAVLDGLPTGNILRVYVMGLWPLIFAVPFSYYGNTANIKNVFWLMYAAAFVRSALGVIGYCFPLIFTVTGAQFILPGLYSQGLELRASALWLLYLGLAAWSMSRQRFHILHTLVALAAIAGVCVGGSRGSLGIMVGIILLWALINRRYWALGILSLLFLSIVVVLNLNYEIVYMLPDRIQRTMSILLFNSPFHDIGNLVAGSNEWHFELGKMAYSQWTASLSNFIFGHRVIPFAGDMENVAQSSFWLGLKIAADMGYYEAGLWTVLALTGIVGGILYMHVIFHLIRPLWAILWKEGIQTPSNALAFVGVSSAVLWFIFSWIIGHFPSEQLLFLVLARAAYADRNMLTKPTN